MKQHSLVYTLVGAAAVAAIVAGLGLSKRPAYAQTGAATLAPGFSETDMHGAANIGTNKDGEAVIAYGNGVVAIVHPGSGASPSGYIHTYRISQSGRVSVLDARAFDADTGKIVGGQ